MLPTTSCFIVTKSVALSPALSRDVLEDTSIERVFRSLKSEQIVTIEYLSLCGITLQRSCYLSDYCNPQRA